MRISQAYEKRDWGSGARTWRPVPALMQRYARHTKGPSTYCVRRLSNKRAKLTYFGKATRP